MIKPVPDGYHSLTPYLIVKGAARAIEFYKTVFGAIEKICIPQADGRICHAEIQIGDSRLMLADEFPEIDAKSPLSLGGTAVSILLYVEDADTVFTRAIAHGAKILKPLTDQPFGDRSGFIMDPFGHKWGIATHIADVSEEEIRQHYDSVK